MVGVRARLGRTSTVCVMRSNLQGRGMSLMSLFQHQAFAIVKVALSLTPCCRGVLVMQSLVSRCRYSGGSGLGVLTACSERIVKGFVQ